MLDGREHGAYTLLIQSFIIGPFTGTPVPYYGANLGPVKGISSQ